MIRDLLQNLEKLRNDHRKGSTMKVAMICFSLTGHETGEKLLQGLVDIGIIATLDKKSRYLPDSVTVSASVWAEEKFAEMDGLIFIGACGIAVRSIAPYVASKKSDPAVLVVDECGRFVISLLSGHLGGANELALKAAKILDAVPVVTTATDLHERFAVDVFAKKNSCHIFDMKAAKEVSAALLAGKKVGFYSEFPIEGKLADGLCLCDENGMFADPLQDAQDQDAKKMELGIAVTVCRLCHPFASTVQIVPRCLTLGLGCRKGKDAEAIAEAVLSRLKDTGLYEQAFEQIASIDLKKEETGICALAENWQVPFLTYTQKELMEVKGTFTPSSFVKKTTGADNVCERSAVLASENGRLLFNKKGQNGVTTAVAAREWRIHFE